MIINNNNNHRGKTKLRHSWVRFRVSYTPTSRNTGVKKFSTNFLKSDYSIQTLLDSETASKIPASYLWLL